MRSPAGTGLWPAMISFTLATACEVKLTGVLGALSPVGVSFEIVVVEAMCAVSLESLLPSKPIIADYVSFVADSIALATYSMTLGPFRSQKAGRVPARKN